jgi:phosphoserine phosphatase RsbU/P
VPPLKPRGRCIIRPMYPSDARQTAGDILNMLRRDWSSIFLAAAFATVGLVSAAFTFPSRKFTPFLFWFSLFSLLYGLRMWIGLDIVQVTLPSSVFFADLRNSLEYLLPIPAFFYFETAGLLQ